MKALHRGLEVSRSAERLQAEVLKHDAAKLQSTPILQYVFDEIAKRDADLVDQIDQVDRALWKLTDRRQDLTQQRRWLAEQRDQLLREAEEEKR